jgi:hypothetical protein
MLRAWPAFRSLFRVVKARPAAVAAPAIERLVEESVSR